MAGATFEFLAFSLIVIVVLNLRARSVVWRQTVLATASAVFLFFLSRSIEAWLPLFAFLLGGYLSLRAVQAGFGRRAYAPILIGLILAYIWLKKYTFLPQATFLSFTYTTLGLSYIFFRVLHLVIDARGGTLTERVTPLSYLTYTLNFSTFVSGPIQRYQDFASMQLAADPLGLKAVIAAEAFERIVIGFFKVNVVSMLLSTAHAHALIALDQATDFGSKLAAGVLVAALYPLYLYFNFSGYIDLVIGIARFLRVELPGNFNRPFFSDNFLTFWSRWHITLSEWLKGYVYNPLLLMLMRRFPSPRAVPFLGVLAFFVTFFLIGVWHGRTSVFIFFGVLQGLGVSANKLYQIMMGKWLGRRRYRTIAARPVYNLFTRGFTFTWFTFTLLWFWSNWEQLGSIANGLGTPAIAAVWVVIFLSASVLLGAWEWIRASVLAIRWEDEPVLLSRYVRTVWSTALAVVTVAVVLLLNAPAPDIVYKAF